MTEHRDMRASDADRAQIAEHLRRAADEGRLLGYEFDDRLGQALDARTYGELDALVADLPCQRDLVKRPGRARMTLRRPRPALVAIAAGGLATVAVAIGSFTATGVMTSRPSARPPLASIPTGTAFPRPVHAVVLIPASHASVAPVVVSSSPPR